MPISFRFDPIGYVRSPFVERVDAPRQPTVASEAEGDIELCDGRDFERALDGLDTWDYAWVIFVFHRNVEEGRGYRTKVLPPRSDVKRGVFATRSPHRPNAIGLSAVRILSVVGRVVHVKNLDLLDGTPVLDLKPYVPYADAFPDARSGWLEARDPLPAWEVVFAELATSQLDWLEGRGVALRGPIRAALALGPEPHPYRRIRPHGAGMRLALKEWRVDFGVDGRRILVRSLATGYRARDLAEKAGLELHRAFVGVYG